MIQFPLLRHFDHFDKQLKGLLRLSNHWVAQRVSAIALIPLSSLFVFMLISSLCDVHFHAFQWNCVFLSLIVLLAKAHVIFFALSLLALAHLVTGIKNIIQDYVHNEKTEMLTISSLQCVQIVTFKHSFVFVFEDIFIDP